MIPVASIDMKWKIVFQRGTMIVKIITYIFLYKWIIRFLGIDSRFDYVNVFITVDENGDCLNASELLYNNSYMNSSLVANNEIIR